MNLFLLFILVSCGGSLGAVVGSDDGNLVTNELTEKIRRLESENEEKDAIINQLKNIVSDSLIEKIQRLETENLEKDAIIQDLTNERDEQKRLQGEELRKKQNLQAEILRLEPFKIAGEWSFWGYWTTCSRSCGGGVKERRRMCDNPAPSCGGPGCVGNETETSSCNEHPCVNGDDRCEFGRHKTKIGDFQRCMVKSQDNYLKKRAEEDFDLQSDTCSMFRYIIMDCGELLTKCFSEEEVREMREEYIIQLVSQYDQQQGFDAHQCAIVREYRESERFTADDEYGDCNDRQSARVRADVQTCNRKYATEAQEKLQDVSDANIIRFTLCQAFAFIATTCSDQLRECAANSEDFLHQKNNNLLSVKHFLLTLGQDQGGDNVLDNCPGITTDSITEPPQQMSNIPEPTTTVPGFY